MNCYYTPTFADVIAAFVVGLLVMEWICEAIRVRDLKEHNVAMRDLHERVVNYERERDLRQIYVDRTTIIKEKEEEETRDDAI